MPNEQTNTTDTPGTPTDTPVAPTELPSIKAAREEREKLEKTLETVRKERAEFEEMKAQEALSGQVDAGQRPKKPEPLSNKEYAKKLQMGEVNPLKEDGFE